MIVLPNALKGISVPSEIISWLYHYDANGNLTETVEQVNVGGGVWDQVERWVYDWNPRDQMTRAMMGEGGSANNA